MVRVFLCSMQSSISAVRRVSAFALWVENANPIMFCLVSEKKLFLVEMMLDTEWRSRMLAMLDGRALFGNVSLYVSRKALNISAASSRWVAVSSFLADLKMMEVSIPSIKNWRCSSKSFTAGIEKL